jgi:hypothetical protein
VRTPVDQTARQPWLKVKVSRKLNGAYEERYLDLDLAGRYYKRYYERGRSSRTGSKALIATAAVITTLVVAIGLVVLFTVA